MNYIKRTVRSRPGLTQEQALTSLQEHPQFRSGTRIASIRRRGKVWVADLLEPKVAGPFPPSDDDPSDDSGSAPAPSSDSEEEESGPPSSSGESDSPSSEDSGPPSDGPPSGDKPEGGKGNVDEAILHTLQQILHALQGGPVGEGLGGPDDLGPDAGPPKPHPPHGGPEGAPAAGGKFGPGAGAKLKPGEVPNKPGVTPVGAPAFASTRRAEVTPLTPELAEALQICQSAGYAVLGPDGNPIGAFDGGAVVGPGNTRPSPEVENAARSFQANIPGAPVPAGAGAPGVPPAQGTCPTCGKPQPCACSASTPAAAGQAMARRAATFTASRPANVTVKQAKAELDAEFGPQGYTVKRIKREGNVIRALLSARR